MITNFLQSRFAAALKPVRLSTVFYKFLISYILLILIPILGLGSLSYLVFSNSIQHEAQRNNALILSKMSDILDQQLTATKNMMYQTVLNFNGTQTDYAKMQDAANLLARIMNTDKFISDIFVYYPESNAIIRSDGLYQADFFFQHFYNYDGSSLNLWLQQYPRSDFSVLPTQNVKVRDYDSKQMITFLTSFPLYNQKIDGTLVVLLDSAKLLSIMNNSLEASDGQSRIVILNQQLQTIASSGMSLQYQALIDQAKSLLIRQTKESEGTASTDNDYVNTKLGEFSLTYLHSHVVDWRYVVLTSIDQISKPADSIRFLTLLICSVLLVIGLLIAIIISHNFTKPIYEIMSIFKPDLRLNGQSRKPVDEFQTILQHLRLVMSDHHALAEKSEFHQSLLKDYYVKSVILGDDPEKTEKLGQLDELFIYPLYTVIVIRIITEDLGFERSSHKSQIKYEAIGLLENMLKEQNEIVGLLTNTGGDMISILANYHNDDTLRAQLEYIRGQLKEKLAQRLWIGVGNGYDRLHLINQAYRDACSALQYRRMNSETQILYYSEGQNLPNQHLLQIPPEAENQLTWAVMAGDQQRSMDQLELLFGQLDEDQTFIRTCEFAQGLLRIVDKLLVQHQLSKSEVLEHWYDLLAVNDTFSLTELKDYVKKTFEQLCQYFYTRAGSRDKQLEDSLLAFIHRYYAQDLSLNFMAEEFNMNPKYLSRFFKERFGINFLDFVNQLRVMKAKELMIQEPQLQINKIASEVGIFNVNTFISVFKKYEGVTPGRYRESLGK